MMPRKKLEFGRSCGHEARQPQRLRRRSIGSLSSPRIEPCSGHEEAIVRSHSYSRSTGVFGQLDAQFAFFSSNEKYLVGITTHGTVFKVDLTAKKFEVIEGVTLKAASVALSPTNAKLYVAGDGLTVIDIDMRVMSEPTKEKNLLEIAASPDDHTLVLRNWHDI